MLSICNAIEIPPKPNRKAHNIMFNESEVLGIRAILQTPFVNSTIPVIIPSEKVVGIFNRFRIGDMISVAILKKPLFLRMDIITEKRTIKPPIKNIVFIEFIIELDRTSPKLEIDTDLGVKSGGVVSFILVLLAFHHLNKKPTVIHERM